MEFIHKLDLPINSSLSNMCTHSQSSKIKLFQKRSIYAGKAIAIDKRWKQHIEAIQDSYLHDKNDKEMKYQKIVHYLTTNNLPMSSIKFSILEKEKSFYHWSDEKLSEREKYWIHKTNAGKAGFNAIR